MSKQVAETFTQLVKKANIWITQNQNLSVTNFQTLHCRVKMSGFPGMSWCVVFHSFIAWIYGHLNYADVYVKVSYRNANPGFWLLKSVSNRFLILLAFIEI